MVKTKTSATRAAEAEIFDLLKFSDAQRAEARDSIDFEKSDHFIQNPKIGEVLEEPAVTPKPGSFIPVREVNGVLVEYHFTPPSTKH